MARTKDPYRRLLNLADKWLEHTDNLVKLNHQHEQYRDNTPTELTQAIEKEKRKIARLEQVLEMAADRVIRAPLTLPELDKLSVPCRDYLQNIKLKILDGDITEARRDCDEIRYLLELKKSCTPSDRALFNLFLAETLSREGSCEGADALTEHRLIEFPLDDHQSRAAVYLIQGNLSATDKRLMPLKAKHAYSQAAEQLSILHAYASEEGYQGKAKAFEVLKDGVETGLHLVEMNRTRSGGVKAVVRHDEQPAQPAAGEARKREAQSSAADRELWEIEANEWGQILSMKLSK